MQVEHRYEDHQGMFIQILGWEATQEGEGVDPFMKAIRTHNPEKGGFSTWLFHNLTLSKRKRYNKIKEPHSSKFLPLEDALKVDGVSQPQQIVEFRDQLNHLSEDAKTVVNCVLKSVEESNPKRTMWPTPSSASAKQIRGELKLHCRETLSWKWERYWDAVHEIENLFK